MSKKKSGNKKAKEQGQRVPLSLKLNKKKVDKIYQLEKKYWDEIRKRRSYLHEIAPEINNNLEPFFPSNVSSRIYACIDGVVLLRYTLSNQPSKFEILYFDETLGKFLKHFPVPTPSGEINLSSFVGIGPGSDVKIISSVFNDVIIEWLWVNSFFYSDDRKLAKIEEALTDFRIYTTGLSIDPDFKSGKSMTEEKEASAGKYEDVINQFEDLLDDATKEEEVQQFLKEYPFLIRQSMYVYPKQKLGEDFVTDFILVNMLDQGPKYTLVEIERPSMRILTEGNEFTAEFKHAEKQILDWIIWLEQNQDYIQRRLERFESPSYLIIGGRSKDMTEEEKRYIRAWNRSQKNTEFLSYDDLLVQARELLASLRKYIAV